MILVKIKLQLCLNLCDISIAALKKSHTQTKSNPDAPEMLFMYWDNSEVEQGQRKAVLM